MIFMEETNMERIIRAHEEKLLNMDPGDGEYLKLVSALNTLYESRDAVKKTEIELKRAQSEEDKVDIERAKAQVDANRVDVERATMRADVFKTATTALTSIAGLAVSIFSIGSVLKFEECGYIRTKAFNMLPKFKWF